MTAPREIRPRWDGYFADPFVLRTADGWIAYGTAGPDGEPASVPALRSADLERWEPLGNVLTGVPPSLGDDVWAPEVAEIDGAWWMYYSVGHGIDGHHLRAARADRPEGPFTDAGVSLTPDELFAIDAHPFADADGRRWLFYARDVLDAEHRGTHLAVAELLSPTTLGPAVPVLTPDSPWQLYEADRLIHDERGDWYTLEGASVLRRRDRLVLTFSGGRWEGEGYGVSSATAERPEGPWTHERGDAADVLSTAIAGVPGPGHNSLVEGPDGETWIAFHAWNGEGTARQLYVEPLDWDGDQPRLRR